MKNIKHILATTFVALSLTAACTASAEGMPPEKMKQLQGIMQQQIGMMKPELQKKVKALSPATKKLLMKILSQHNRYSDRATLRQVMHEVQSDYQSMLTGIMIDHPEQAADSAMRLANHRIPVAGLLPYMGLENINDGQLAVLDGFNSAVEGSAKKLAAAARAGDTTKAASYVGDITSGCVACHAFFRGQPGKSSLIK
ncbi:MAG: hypothetical protein OQK78_03075 [Gammaproteobacteria bacterium]|nr:hypothetical protein [Gammaproteobacteria bacterium]